MSIIQALLLATFSAAASAGEPLELDRGTAPNHPQQPQLAVDSEGSIHLVYGVGNVVRYRRSVDGGKAFSQPVDISAAATLSLGMRRGPRIAATEKSICITAVGGEHGRGRDGDLLAMRSLDGGKSWTGPVKVNDMSGSAREGLHAMCAGPNGEIGCVWLDLRTGKTEVLASRSTDGGQTWGKNVLVYRSPDGSVCECCHPSIAIDDRGAMYVQWRNSLAGARDIFFATSADGGRTFGKASKVGSDSWRLKACPMDGGAIAATADRQLVSVWRRDGTVYLSEGTLKGERSLGFGEQPWLATTREGPFVVWLRRRGEAAFLLTPGNTAPQELASNAKDPVISAARSGSGPVAAAWESRQGNATVIYFQVVDHE